MRKFTLISTITTNFLFYTPQINVSENKKGINIINTSSTLRYKIMSHLPMFILHI